MTLPRPPRWERAEQRCGEMPGHSPWTDPGGNGRSLPAAPQRAQQRENGETAKVTPFQENYEIEIQEPFWDTFLTESALTVPFFMDLRLLVIPPPSRCCPRSWLRDLEIMPPICQTIQKMGRRRPVLWQNCGAKSALWLAILDKMVYNAQWMIRRIIIYFEWREHYATGNNYRNVQEGLWGRLRHRCFQCE